MIEAILHLIIAALVRNPIYSSLLSVYMVGVARSTLSILLIRLVNAFVLVLRSLGWMEGFCRVLPLKHGIIILTEQRLKKFVWDRSWVHSDSLSVWIELAVVTAGVPVFNLYMFELSFASLIGIWFSNYFLEAICWRHVLPYLGGSMSKQRSITCWTDKSLQCIGLEQHRGDTHLNIPQHK